MADADAAAREGAASPRWSRRLALFLRSIACDYVLVLVVSCALAFTVSYGFNSAPELRASPGVYVVADALVLACLYVGLYSRRAVGVAAVLYVVMALALVMVISSLSPEQVALFEGGQVNDVENNYAVFGIVVVVVPLVVFLLSRRTWELPLLLLVGALTCCSVQFLYRDWVASQPGTAAALVALSGIGALFVVQGYRQGVLSSHAAKKTAFIPALLYGVVGALACVGMGAAVFFGIVAGLGLQTVDFKPFEDYYSRPIIEYDGTYQQQQVLDPDLGTSRLSEEEGDTIDDAQGELTEDEPDDSGGGFSLVNTMVDMLNLDNWNSMFDAIRFNVPFPLQVLLALLPLLVVLAIVWARRHTRVRRLKKLADRSYSERVAALYGFVMDRFRRLKVNRTASLTPLEFALAAGPELAGFNRNEAGADLLSITLAYQRAAFGAGATEEDCALLEGYYRSFFKNARARMGALKWAFWGFWRI